MSARRAASRRPAATMSSTAAGAKSGDRRARCSTHAPAAVRRVCSASQAAAWPSGSSAWSHASAWASHSSARAWRALVWSAMVVSLGGGLLPALLLRGASDGGGGQWAASHQQPPPRPVAPGRVVGLVDAGPAGGVALPPAAGGVAQLGYVGLRRQLPPF